MLLQPTLKILKFTTLIIHQLLKKHIQFTPQTKKEQEKF